MPTHSTAYRTIHPCHDPSGLSWFLQSTLRKGFPRFKISSPAPPGNKATSSNNSLNKKQLFHSPPEKALAVHSLHLHYVSVLPPFRYRFILSDLHCISVTFISLLIAYAHKPTILSVGIAALRFVQPFTVR